MDFKKLIKEIPDFPNQGVLFKDLNKLMKDPNVWIKVIENLSLKCKYLKPDLIVGIEARGFIVGSSLASIMNIGFVPFRKIGKLPGEVITENYDLEYGNDGLEAQVNAIEINSRILIVDDLLATGGTAKAAEKIVRKLGGLVIGFAFIVELKYLKGRKLLPEETPVISIVNYD